MEWEYYHDILQDSGKYGFAMNFHGATLPRGWMSLGLNAQPR